MKPSPVLDYAENSKIWTKHAENGKIWTKHAENGKIWTKHAENGKIWVVKLNSTTRLSILKSFRAKMGIKKEA